MAKPIQSLKKAAGKADAAAFFAAENWNAFALNDTWVLVCSHSAETAVVRCRRSS